MTYLVFSGLTFYPGAPWDDFRGCAATLAEAQALLPLCEAYGLDWYQIINGVTATLVEQGPLVPHAATPFCADHRTHWAAFVAKAGKGAEVA